MGRHTACLPGAVSLYSFCSITNSAPSFTQCLSLGDKLYGHHRLEQNLYLDRAKEASRPICPCAQQPRSIPGRAFSVQSQKWRSPLILTWVSVSPPCPFPPSFPLLCPTLKPASLVPESYLSSLTWSRSILLHTVAQASGEFLDEGERINWGFRELHYHVWQVKLIPRVEWSEMCREDDQPPLTLTHRANKQLWARSLKKEKKTHTRKLHAHVHTQEDMLVEWEMVKNHKRQIDSALKHWEGKTSSPEFLPSELQSSSATC